MTIPKNVHLLGMGGAGMAGLAELLRDMGVTVSGSDREQSDTAKRLIRQGFQMDFKENPASLSGADCCVYSTALDKNHPQRRKAEKTMPTFSRGEFLGKVSQQFDTVAAVAGTHGKTTVSALLTYILTRNGQNPSFLIGGTCPQLGANGKKGSKGLLVCEACEFMGSFLHLKRDLGILLNIDNDHLECYGDMEHLCHAFGEFTSGCKRVLVNGENQNAMTVTKDHPHRFFYGTKGNPHFKATHIKEHNGFYSFTLHLPKGKPQSITLQIPGRHQIENALAAAGAAYLLGTSPTIIAKGLNEFNGVARRFQIICRNEHITVADDYAHHPAEIESVLIGAKQMGYSNITAVFQPFTYSRTKALTKEFANALSHADHVILAPIMGGREPFDPQISSAHIARHLKNATLSKDLYACAHAALKQTQKGGLILTLGCGNVYRCAQKIAEIL
jgi:UDP-N-acetylmuramate--alanine ligase